MPLSRMLERIVPDIADVPADVWRYLLLALTIPVVGWAGRHFYSRAWTAARHRIADMNTLIALGTGAAFLFSLAMTLADDLVCRPGYQAAGVLRGGCLDYRSDPAGQSAGGSGKESDLGGTAAAHCPAATLPRECCVVLRSRPSPSTICESAIGCWSARARRSPRME